MRKTQKIALDLVSSAGTALKTFSEIGYIIPENVFLVKYQSILNLRAICPPFQVSAHQFNQRSPILL
jgi:hypothetical protein